MSITNRLKEQAKLGIRLLLLRLIYPGIFGDRTDSLKVIAGPFAGMLYRPYTHCSTLCPKILGTYELELKLLVEEFIATGFDDIIVIGAAEGYYLTGFALRTRARIIGFEADPTAACQARNLARLNAVQPDLRGLCTPDDLRDCIKPGLQTLVLCDVEGAETDLLDPLLIPALTHSTLLIETHDHLHPGTTEILHSRFSTTHTIKEFPVKSRTPEDFPSGRTTGKFNRLLIHILGNEGRCPSMSWLHCSPKSSGGI